MKCLSLSGEGLRKPDRKILNGGVVETGLCPRRPGMWAITPWSMCAFDAGLTPVWRYTRHWQRPEVPTHEIHGRMSSCGFDLNSRI